MTSSLTLPSVLSAPSMPQTVPGKSGRKSVRLPPACTLTLFSGSFAGSFTVSTTSFASPVIIDALDAGAADADADADADAVSVAGAALAVTDGVGVALAGAAGVALGAVLVDFLSSHATVR